MSGKFQRPDPDHPEGPGGLIKDVAYFILNEYHVPSIKNEVNTDEGYMIPVVPERRFTASPTGGIVGRYFELEATRASTTPSEAGNMNNPPPPNPQGNGPNKPHAASKDGDYEGSYHSRAFGCLAASPMDLGFVPGRIPSKIPEPENMSKLVVAHRGRPGENLLRLDPIRGQVYACIPLAPKPLPRLGRNLPPGVPNRPEKTCDHCAAPPRRILQARNLCAAHVVFLVTGELPTRYECAALAELEAAGYGPLGGWSVELTMEFYLELQRHMGYITLLAGSVPDEEDQERRKQRKEMEGPGGYDCLPPPAKPNPWGAIGADREDKAERFVRKGLDGMGPRLYQVYREAINGVTF